MRANFARARKCLLSFNSNKRGSFYSTRKSFGFTFDAGEIKSKLRGIQREFAETNKFLVNIPRGRYIKKIFVRVYQHGCICEPFISVRGESP